MIKREGPIPGRQDDGQTADQAAERWCGLAGIHLRQLKRWHEQPAKEDGTRPPLPLSTAFAMVRKYLFERLVTGLPTDPAADPRTQASRDRGGGTYELLLESLPAEAQATARSAKETAERSIAALEHLRTGAGPPPSETTLNELEAIFAAIHKRGTTKRYSDFMDESAPTSSDD